MRDKTEISGFFDTVVPLREFDALSDAENYVPLPEDWLVGVADIRGSTEAIAAGQYKTVNMVGAAVISAQINRAEGRAFPFVFGGDGAAFACAPEDAGRAGAALAAVQSWAEEEFGIELRAALVPVAGIRQAGREVSVARYRVSEGVDYAMFAGGGISWAEAEMKAGRIAVPPAPSGTQPDLTGLSCRWSHIRAANGTILSLVVLPVAQVPGPRFAALAHRIIAIAQRLERGGHPAPEAGPAPRWPPPGLELEARASHGDVPVAKRRRQLWWNTLLGWFLFRTNLPFGPFRPGHYRRATSRNADFRKFDDGLKMTLDCDAATVTELRAVLEEAQGAGVARFGLFEQAEAMMTCIVPSVLEENHVHFIDGAAGGYASAAAQIKADQGGGAAPPP